MTQQQTTSTDELVGAVETLRGVLGITVPELALMIERDRTHLWRVLHGQATATPDLLSRCLMALGATLHDQQATRG